MFRNFLLYSFITLSMTSCINIDITTSKILVETDTQTTIEFEHMEYTIKIDKPVYTQNDEVHASFFITNTTFDTFEAEIQEGLPYRWELLNSKGVKILSSRPSGSLQMMNYMISSKYTVRYDFIIDFFQINGQGKSLSSGYYTLSISLNYPDAIGVAITIYVK